MVSVPVVEEVAIDIDALTGVVRLAAQFCTENPDQIRAKLPTEPRGSGSAGDACVSWGDEQTVHCTSRRVVGPAPDGYQRPGRPNSIMRVRLDTGRMECLVAGAVPRRGTAARDAPHVRPLHGQHPRLRPRRATTFEGTNRVIPPCCMSVPSRLRYPRTRRPHELALH